MHPIAKSRLASGSICPIRNMCTSTLSTPAPSRPPAQGLYDPRHEHDACGVGFVAHIKGQKSPRHRQPGAAAARQPAAPRRVRMRGQHRRRRRHPDADAGPLLPQGGRPARDRRCRRSAATAPGWCSCRAIRRSRERVETLFEEIVIEEGQLVLGWRDVPTDDRDARSERRGGRAGVQADLHRARARAAGAGRVDRGRRAVRAQALRDPQADRARDRRGGPAAGGEALLLRRQPVVEHA